VAREVVGRVVLLGELHCLRSTIEVFEGSSLAVLLRSGRYRVYVEGVFLPGLGALDVPFATCGHLVARNPPDTVVLPSTNVPQFGTLLSLFACIDCTIPTPQTIMWQTVAGFLGLRPATRALTTWVLTAVTAIVRGCADWEREIIAHAVRAPTATSEAILPLLPSFIETHLPSDIEVISHGLTYAFGSTFPGYILKELLFTSIISQTHQSPNLINAVQSVLFDMKMFICVLNAYFGDKPAVFVTGAAHTHCVNGPAAASFFKVVYGGTTGL